MNIFTCDSLTSRLDSLLGNLDGVGTSFSSSVDSVVSDVNSLLTVGMTPKKEIKSAIDNVLNETKTQIIDYTNRLNNSGPALTTYDDDLKAFQKMLKKCSSSKLGNFLKTLELGIDFPDLPDIDFPFIGSSEITNAVKGILAFPLTYLKTFETDILDGFSLRILELSGNIPEFLLGKSISLLGDSSKDIITSISKEIDVLLQCAEELGCSSTGYQDSYKDIMEPLPLKPSFELPEGSKPGLPTIYDIDTDDVMIASHANEEQSDLLKSAYSSYDDSMKYAKSLTSRYNA